MFDASATIADVRQYLQGEPVFLAGSLCAAAASGKPFAFSDVDVFCPTSNQLIALGMKLQSEGFTLDDRMSRVWARWLRYGTKGWHTNSLRLESPQGQEVNLVYKLADGHPTTSLSQVLESFDFGLLGFGVECEDWVERDLRPYLFPQWTGLDPNQPLPLMPNKRANWRNGYISQYNGLREAGRYVKYHGYGYDLSLVKDDLVTGYYQAEMYYATTHKPEQQMLGKIYGQIGGHLDADRIDDLILAYKDIDYNDALDSIMAALE